MGEGLMVDPVLISLTSPIVTGFVVSTLTLSPMCASGLPNDRVA